MTVCCRLAEFPLGPLPGAEDETFIRGAGASHGDVVAFVLRPCPLPYHDGVASLITLFLFVFATVRTCELVIGDAIAGPLRDWWESHTPEGSLRRKFITCYWCVSIWAAGLIWAPVYAVFFGPGRAPWWVWWPVATMAFSYLAVLIADAQKLLNHKQSVMAALMAPPDQPDADGR